MNNLYVTKMVKAKLKEEDQVFEVGNYNVYFDMGEVHDNGEIYHSLFISEFIGDREINRKRFYVRKYSEQSYPKNWEKLHDESWIRWLMRGFKDNSRIG